MPSWRCFQTFIDARAPLSWRNSDFTGVSGHSKVMFTRCRLGVHHFEAHAWKYLHSFLILHSLQELLTEGRINTIGLRQRPLAPLFEFVD
jgi:hypothetical protein